jgi:hypothetical protein
MENIKLAISIVLLPFIIIIGLILTPFVWYYGMGD